jgi:hypothetical protein
MRLFAPPGRSLPDALAGRVLTGLIVETGRLFLRLPDETICVDLATRDWRTEKRSDVWLTFPGWLLIRRVVQDNSQVSLDISGALYSARISARLVHGEWTLVMPKQIF